MADAVSAGASAAVEELVTSPPTKRTSSISALAAEDAVRSVSFLVGGTVIGAEATWFEWGSFGGMSIGISVCRLSLVSASPCSGLLLCVGGTSESHKRTDGCRILSERRTTVCSSSNEAHVVNGSSQCAGCGRGGF